MVRKFLCPVCRLPLSECKLDRAMYYNCHEHGVLAPISFFSFYPKARQIIPDFYLARNSEVRTRDTEIKCPTCYNKMVATPWRKISGLVLDQCLYCNNIWFDKNELSLVSQTNELAKKFPTQGTPVITTRVIEKKSQYPRSELLPHEQMTPLMWIGLPTEVEEKSTRVAPWITIIFILMAGLFTAKGLKNMDIIKNYAFIPGSPFLHLIKTSVTSLFLHASWMHFFSNAYFLYLVADNIEETEGSRFTFFLFLAAGVFGNIAYLATSQYNTPSIGASGAVFGLMAYYALRFPNNRIRFARPIGNIFTGTMHVFSLSAPTAFIFYFLLNIINLIIQTKVGARGGVNFAAHIGGALTGLFCYLIFAKHRDEIKN